MSTDNTEAKKNPPSRGIAGIGMFSQKKKEGEPILFDSENLPNTTGSPTRSANEAVPVSMQGTPTDKQAARKPHQTNDCARQVSPAPAAPPSIVEEVAPEWLRRIR